jgi:hypothetical protein
MLNKLQSIKDWRDDLRPFYFGLGSLYSKALRDNVHFNNYGWKHLVFHNNGGRRNEKDIRLRLGLVKNIPEVIKRCKTVRKVDVRDQIFSGNTLSVSYFELAHKFTFGKKEKERQVTIVVVLRKIENQNLHFWSTRYDKKQKRA